MLTYLYVAIETIQKRPRTPLTNNPTMDYQTAGSGLAQRRPRPFWLSDEVHIQSKPFPVYH